MGRAAGLIRPSKAAKAKNVAQRAAAVKFQLEEQAVHRGEPARDLHMCRSQSMAQQLCDRDY